MYFVSASEFEVKRQLDIVAAKLVEIWQKCNPLLPVLKEISLYVKLKRFMDQVKAVNRKQKGCKQAQSFVESRKDRLFDISACNCKLQILPCDHRLAQCKAAPGHCDKQHIVCECPQVVFWIQINFFSDSDPESVFSDSDLYTNILTRHLLKCHPLLSHVL
jgi:hypothetical protein